MAAPVFHVELVKPSHYDKDGYVIQWWKAWIPSNSLACLYGIAQACGEQSVLGADVRIEVEAYDEMNIAIPVQAIAERVRQPGHAGLVCMVGVQSNQYPRALDLAKQFRARGLQVAIGGFHVSGCMSMLKDLTPDLQEALDLGITLFAGEAEEHFQQLLQDAAAGAMRPIYNHMDDLPNLQTQTIPFLPRRLVERYDGMVSSFDAGRGCPFQCSFCTIINVQGRKSRWRDADDIERLVRQNAEQGISRFFITDDNFARNRNWEAIFDRLIALRESGGPSIRFLIQVDALAHKIPNFIEKAARAGCNLVFIGLENVNSDNLVQMKKKQNKIAEYRRMFQAWKNAGIVTYAGYIMGLPGDTPESLRRDVETVQRELPVDILEFTMLTPLPGSEDHKVLHEKGVWMDPDLNKYDLETVTVKHPRMSQEVWQQTYQDMWKWYYTDEHVERLMRRNIARGIKPIKIWRAVMQVYAAPNFEGVHPQQCGYLRRKDRTQRRPSLPRVPAVIFYPRHAAESVVKYLRIGAYAWKIYRMCKRLKRDESARSYTDLAIAPVVEGQGDEVGEFALNNPATARKPKREAKPLETVVTGP